MPNIRMMDVPRQSRVLRRPQHTFHLRQRPWQIQPCMLAPVLPGETMRNLLCQARVVSDPLANALIGWWCEFYFFYCKHRDLDNRDAYTAMMLDLASIPATDAAAAHFYHAGGHVNWTLQCLKRVVAEYFRNSGEAWDLALLDSVPLASIDDSSWLDSAVNVAAWDTADADIVVGGDDTITASEIDMARRQWEFMRANNLTAMDYEDFLKTYGVRPQLSELHRPELIRYVRGWTYPTNTIDPTDGTPTSAASWAISERADKDRFFPEPGFIFGVCVVRPKTYRRTQVGSAVALMDRALAWLPAILNDDPTNSHQVVDNAAGSPLTGITTDYVVDIKDLLLYGDQFLNFAPGGVVNANAVDLPTPALARRYASSADANNLYIDNTGAGGLNKVRIDGVVSINIAGSQKETSSTT